MCQVTKNRTDTTHNAFAEWAINLTAATTPPNQCGVVVVYIGSPDLWLLTNMENIALAKSGYSKHSTNTEKNLSPPQTHRPPVQQTATPTSDNPMLAN